MPKLTVPDLFLSAKALVPAEGIEGYIKRSTLDWVIVRPGRLTNRPFTGRYRFGEDVAERTLLASISRADVADFIVKQFTCQLQVDHRFDIPRSPQSLVRIPC
jgi:uncharacterized protein YbjT (DUF2867 family)